VELGREEEERKKIIKKIHPYNRGRYGTVRTLGKAFEFTCTCSSADNERDQRNIYLFIPEGKKRNPKHFR
jgi:hypothetical protein